MANVRRAALLTLLVGVAAVFYFGIHEHPTVRETFIEPALDWLSTLQQKLAFAALPTSETVVAQPRDSSTTSYSTVAPLVTPEAALGGSDGAQATFAAPVTPANSSRAPFTRHIVAVGDLHGDFGNAQKVLQFAGVVDDLGNWAGGVDFFVQTGDIIDRGDDTIKLFLWMERLRIQAAQVGAQVLSVLGNHELMNAIGDWRYVYPSEIATFGSIAARQQMLTTGRIGRAWATNYTAAVRLPLHPHLGAPNTPFPPPESREDEIDGSHYLDPNDPLSHSALSFVHGGLSPTYSNLAPYPTKINALSSSFLRKLQDRVQPPPHPPYEYPMLPYDTTMEEIEMYDANGPFWYRGWATDPESKACVDVEKVLAQTGVSRLIVGHTPDFTGIVSRCNGKIIIIDTGISHAYGGVLSALSIHYTLTPVGDDEEERWIEREIVSTLYADRQEIIADEVREVVGNFRLQ